MRRALTAISCCLFASCATATKGDFELLKPTLDAFHGRMRWKDYRLLQQQLVPEKRGAFMKASDDRDDTKNLYVTDYQLEECQVTSSDQTIAVCMSKVSWYRLPSASEKTVTVATTLKWQGGQWLIDRQSDGPFADELSMVTTAPRPAPAPAPDAQKSTP